VKLRQQNSTNYPIGILMIDSTDHISGKTGLSPTVTLSKNNASFAAPAGAVTEIGNGWYSLAANATDRNTVGEFLIHATATGADPFDDKYEIVPWNPYDAVRLGLTAIPNVVQGNVGALPVGDASGAVAANNLPTDYQQRGIAVTLPAAPAGYGGGTGEEVITRVTSSDIYPAVSGTHPPVVY
jgi:hypothetical protein